MQINEGTGRRATQRVPCETWDQWTVSAPHPVAPSLNSASIYKIRGDSGAPSLPSHAHFPPLKHNWPQPSRRIPHSDSPTPMCYAKDSHRGYPGDPPRAGLISWAALVIYIAVSPPLLFPAVIPEQDVAHKSFPWLATTHGPAYFYRSCHFPSSPSVRPQCKVTKVLGLRSLPITRARHRQDVIRLPLWVQKSLQGAVKECGHIKHMLSPET